MVQRTDDSVFVVIRIIIYIQEFLLKDLLSLLERTNFSIDVYMLRTIHEIAHFVK